MTFRQLEQRRHRRLAAERWRRLLQALGRMTVVLLAAGLAGWAMHTKWPFRDRPPHTDLIPQPAVLIPFGTGREPLTRTITLPRTASRSSGARPGGLVVRLDSDLIDAHTGHQFPARQVTLSVNEVSPMAWALTISADPWSPEQIAGGSYRGQITLFDGGSTPAIVPVVIDADDRGGSIAWIALFVLMVGAAAGLLIKWITERLTHQAMSYRRLAALRRAVGWGPDGRHLPAAARLRIEELDDLIGRQDFGRAEQLFAELEAEREPLAALAGRFDALYELLAAHARLGDGRSTASTREVSTRVDNVLDECHRRLLSLQNEKWPEEVERITKELDTMRLNFVTAGQVIDSFLGLPHEAQLRGAMDLLQRGDYDAASAAYDRFLQINAVDAGDSAKSTSRRRLPRPQWALLLEEPPLPPVFRLHRPIVGAASVVVVSAVGLKFQYLDNQAFQGDLTAWLTLGLWGFVIELSGTSVLEVVARLGAGRGNTETGAATRA